jgi:branched-chain amino acid transport system permease protein
MSSLIPATVRSPSRPTLASAAACAALVLLPALLSDYSLSVAQKILIFGLLAVSLDLLYGYGGLPSLGQAAYFGIGGYAVALLMIKGGVTSIWLVMPVGVAITAACAAIFGPLALRTSGLYFLLVTFALGQLLAAIAVKWEWLHSFGVEGIAGLSTPTLGIGQESWTPNGTYYLVLVVFVLGYLFARRLVSSPLGYALQGIREREQRMEVFGYDTWRCRYVTFVVAGALAGVAGQLFAFTSGIVLPTNVDITYSALAFLMVVVGGAGTIYGPVIGAATIVLLEHYASSALADRWPLILGLAFVAAAMLLRGGIVSLAHGVMVRGPR